MFGIIRPCRHRLGDDLRRDWLAQLCGLCLALRDEHGHAARLVTNYDAIVVSALVEAQGDTRRRTAGPCALRGLRRAEVTEGDAARLAASVSLLLASAKLRDHVSDGDIDGRLRTRAGLVMADRFARAGARTGRSVALDADALLDAANAQAAAEVRPASLLQVTAPTETATALAFRQTAVVAGRPANAEALGEIGGLFGRLAHLLDAVEDLDTDRTAGLWNPITALELTIDEVGVHCRDAVLGIRLALRDVEFTDDRLVHALLVHELAAAVQRTLSAGQPDPPPLTPPLPPDQQPSGVEAPSPPARGPIVGCLATLAACGTCQACRSSRDDDDDSAGRRCRAECKDSCTDCCEDACADCCCGSVCDGICNC